LESTDEHKKTHELKISSGAIGAGETTLADKILFLSFEKEEEMLKLERRVRLAQNVRVAKMTGNAAGNPTMLPKSKVTIEDGYFPSEQPGKRLYVWGAGPYMLCSSDNTRAMSVPLRIKELTTDKPIDVISAGPEHAGVVESTKNAKLWGSNEFAQLGQQSAAIAHASAPMSINAGGRVLAEVTMVSCGGSHTLAIVNNQVFVWGTGTVGQLGLTKEVQMQDSPYRITSLIDSDKKPKTVRKVFAGMVSSACITAEGECFLWGDASQGRLGLENKSKSQSRLGDLPQLINDDVVWEPTKLEFSHGDVDLPAGQRPHVMQVALGGTFTLFLLWVGDDKPGCVLLVSGCLGVDITTDHYGYPDHLEYKVVEGMIEDETRKVQFFPGQKPRSIGPFGYEPCVLGISAGVRSAGVIAWRVGPLGQSLLAMTAGKGWLGHIGTADTVLLDQPEISQTFNVAGGELATCGQPVVDIAVGHSHIVALTATGALYSWGRGDSGELGQGGLNDRSMPVRSLDAGTIGTSHYLSVRAGSYYTMAVVGHGPNSPYSSKAPSIVREEMMALWNKEAAEQKAASKSSSSKTSSSSAAAAPAPAPAAAAASKSAPPKAKNSAAAAEAEAKRKAKIDFDAGELPPGWNWEEDPDSGDIFFTQPDDETTWDDPRDNWEQYCESFSSSFFYPTRTLFLTIFYSFLPILFLFRDLVQVIVHTHT
jgi:hypothetical protein